MILAFALLLSGCATYDREGLAPAQAKRIEENFGLKNYALTREQEDRILALDALNVSEQDIRETLSNAPAPRIINIHGGINPVHERLISFSHFLIGMGYPEESIRNPNDGTWTFSCYERADKIAGMIAWYYEKEGLRPMIVGHSQGGMQNVKVLKKYAYSSRVTVWSPLTWKSEKRHEIIDPLTGKKRPVAGLTLPYVTSMGAGGLTRVLPSQWDMNVKGLRTIPNTVEEFTGFYKGNDLLGGDFLGYGPANHFRPVRNGTASVRNIALPKEWAHGAVPDTQHLLKSQAAMDRINSYRPPEESHLVIEANEDTLNPDTLYLPWAQDVWFSIKKHWVLELQRLIRARRGMEPEGDGAASHGSAEVQSIENSSPLRGFRSAGLRPAATGLAPRLSAVGGVLLFSPCCGSQSRAPLAAALFAGGVFPAGQRPTVRLHAV